MVMMLEAGNELVRNEQRGINKTLPEGVTPNVFIRGPVSVRLDRWHLNQTRARQFCGLKTVFGKLCSSGVLAYTI
jgi:hypothetical protein